MNTSRILAALAISLGVAACASGPKHAEMAASIPPLKADEGRIYFYRSNSMMGAAIQPSIYVNGKVVGNSKPGGFFFVDEKAGAKEISTATEVEKKLTFTLDRGQTRYVKTSVGLGLVVGRVYPELVDDAAGAGDVKELSYIGTPLTR